MSDFPSIGRQIPPRIAAAALALVAVAMLALVSGGCTSEGTDEYARISELFALTGSTPPGVVVRMDTRLVHHRHVFAELDAALSNDAKEKIVVLTPNSVGRFAAVARSRRVGAHQDGLYALDVGLDLPEQSEGNDVIGLSSGKHVFYWREVGVEAIRAMIEIVSLDHRALHEQEQDLPKALRSYLVEHYAPTDFPALDGVTVGLFPDVCLACPSGASWQAFGDGSATSARTLLFVPDGLIGVPTIEFAAPGSVVARYAPEDKTLRRLMMQASLLGMPYPAVWEGATR